MLKRIVITGGEGDLARAIAEVFGERGWKVLSPGRSELDVTNRVQVETYFQNLELDLLVCCAGIVSDNLLARVSEAEWDRLYQVNYEGAALAAKQVLRGMGGRKSGHVVFVSSHSAVHPPLGQVAYSSSKAALHGLTEDLARSYGPSNVRINGLLPGFLETKMTQSVSEVRRTQVINDHALRRFNTPQVVARFIYHLHEEMPHTSGQMFKLDSRF